MKKLTKGLLQEGGVMKKLIKNRINYDKKKDILYIVLREGKEERFEDVSENITVEYDAKNRPIGIEIFNASKTFPVQKSSAKVAGFASL